MKKLLWTISILITALTSFTQNVSFVASSPKVVSVGEQFRISYQLNNSGKSFEMPTMKGFRVLAGPNVSNGSSSSWINGNVTQSITQTYTFIVQAQKVGKFTIPPANIKVKSKKYQSNSLKIEVVKKSEESTSSNNNSNIKPEDIYLKLSTPKRNVYLGEPVPLSIKLYTKVDLVDIQNADFPEYKNFYSQDIKMPEQITLQREKVNNSIINSALLDKVLLYPQKTGKITIDAAKIDAIIRQKIRRQRRNVFDDFFGGGYQSFRVPLTSNVLKINVKSLPPNPPESFLGAVGKFNVKASIDNTELNANDALSYKIKISGSGNLKLIKDPKIEFPHDFDVWEPTVNNKITNTASGSKGSRTYEYVIQPRHPGNFDIPAFEFSYFDTQNKKYQTIKTEPFKIKVNHGDQIQTVVSNVGISKEDVELIGKDIRFIKTGPLRLKIKQHPFFASWGYWSFFLGALLQFAIIFLIRRKRIKELSNKVLQKNKKAKKEAVKRLKLAQSYLNKKEQEPFFEAIIKGLQGYLVDKFNIEIADFNTNRVEQELTIREVNSGIIRDLKTIIQECEIARYASSQNNISEKEIYQRSIGLISALENQIKNTKKG